MIPPVPMRQETTVTLAALHDDRQLRAHFDSLNAAVAQQWRDGGQWLVPAVREAIAVVARQVRFDAGPEDVILTVTWYPRRRGTAA